MTTMWKHKDLLKENKQNNSLFSLIRKGEIQRAGNSKLKIVGLLSCSSGKRMKVENRVFFKSEEEATTYGYRPCGHCMCKEYSIWKKLLKTN